MTTILAGFVDMFKSQKTIERINYLGIYDQIANLVNCDAVQDLFDFALQKGLYEIVVYLYVYCGCVFEYSSKNLDRNEEIISSAHVQHKAISNPCGGEGIAMTIYASNALCTNFLIYCKRYSNYTFINNKFMYKFNQKYISNIERKFSSLFLINLNQ